VNILGFPAQKTPKIAKISNFFAANPLPDVHEIRKVYAGNRSTEIINIWCDSVGKLGIYRQKTRWGIRPAGDALASSECIVFLVMTALSFRRCC